MVDCGYGPAVTFAMTPSWRKNVHIHLEVAGHFDVCSGAARYRSCTTCPSVLYRLGGEGAHARDEAGVSPTFTPWFTESSILSTRTRKAPPQSRLDDPERRVHGGVGICWLDAPGCGPGGISVPREFNSRTSPQGAIAQLAERHAGSVNVAGSIPVSSTKVSPLERKSPADVID